MPVHRGKRSSAPAATDTETDTRETDTLSADQAVELIVSRASVLGNWHQN